MLSLMMCDVVPAWGSGARRRERPWSSEYHHREVCPCLHDPQPFPAGIHRPCKSSPSSFSVGCERRVVGCDGEVVGRDGHVVVCNGRVVGCDGSVVRHNGRW